MLDQWLEAIEDLIIDAPGNSDPDAGTVWESTLDRLGEDDADTAKANRVFWEYFEPGEEDIADAIPLFIIAEAEWNWSKGNFNDFAAHGAVEVTYAEKIVDPSSDDGAVRGNAAYKRAKTAYLEWLGSLIQNCAERSEQADIAFTRISQTTPVSRTPPTRRNADRPESDYVWASYQFNVGYPRG